MAKAKRAAEAEAPTTVSISDGNGGMTPPVPLGTFRDAVEKVRRALPMKETDADRAVSDGAYRVTASELRSFVERFERLAAEKAEIADLQKDVMGEAKGRGYSTKALRRIIAIRKRKPEEVAEEEAVLDLYKSALGMG